MTALITIGITAFNARDTLDRAVASALAQSWQPTEIIAVDDGSTDGTWELLGDLARRHPELRAFQSPINGGVAAARNRIIAEARGEFLAFFDDDDESHPERLAVQHARLTLYERDFAVGAPVICHTARRQIYPDGTSCIIGTMGQIEGKRAPSGQAVTRRVLLGQPLEDGYGALATCSQMARLSTYRALNGFDTVFRRCEDSDLAIRLAEAGGHFAGVARPLVTQTMTKTPEKNLATEYHYRVLLLEKHRPIVSSESEYVFCRKWLDLKQAWLEGQRLRFAGRLAKIGLRHPVRTLRRLQLARLNLRLNRAFSKFHRSSSSAIPPKP